MGQIHVAYAYIFKKYSGLSKKKNIIEKTFGFSDSSVKVYQENYEFSLSISL